MQTKLRRRLVAGGIVAGALAFAAPAIVAGHATPTGAAGAPHDPPLPIPPGGSGSSPSPSPSPGGGGGGGGGGYAPVPR